MPVNKEQLAVLGTLFSKGGKWEARQGCKLRTWGNYLRPQMGWFANTAMQTKHVNSINLSPDAILRCELSWDSLRISG
eukprot:scaffold4491_cov19-Tisochrysis_lutea.AAC.2